MATDLLECDKVITLLICCIKPEALPCWLSTVHGLQNDASMRAWLNTDHYTALKLIKLPLLPMYCKKHLLVKNPKIIMASSDCLCWPMSSDATKSILSANTSTVVCGVLIYCIGMFLLMGYCI